MYPKKLFLLVIVFAMFSRGIYFLLSPSIIDGNLSTFPLNPFIFWNHMIDFSFFLAYFMLFISWADIYYQASSGTGSNFFRHKYTIALLIVFIVVSVTSFAVFSFIAADNIQCRLVDMVSTFYIAILNFITAILFTLYGILIFRLIGENEILKRKHSWKIKAITWICSLCFLCRTSLMMFSVLTLTNDPDTFSYNVSWYWILVFFVSLEIIPTLAMLYFLRTPQAKQSSEQQRKSTLYSTTKLTI
ncbi:hypothetical protein DLAC_10823 [Tieghemostelium lacteum]|uniref:THH1/TOM1/TOM3 domain-containing protein n=1 Tax=Tieghemostelium lacteum TaxID=361077 RepID=A0A151Z3W3_TIELA|nr:hypothetical protein DLAC_10823 [Tieghemostelium lacteum]|eukprot:KYQ88649.1 hypothetical protein DLAC_10823 [Tieghemostelium lacteum]